MRAYLLRAPVRPLFSLRRPFCFRTTCTSQACKNGDTNAPLLFFLSHMCYCAASRAITHKRVKKGGKSSPLSLSPSLALPFRSYAFIFVICPTEEEFLSCRHARDRVSRDVIRHSTKVIRRKTMRRMRRVSRRYQVIESRRWVFLTRRVALTCIHLMRNVCSEDFNFLPARDPIFFFAIRKD